MSAAPTPGTIILDRYEVLDVPIDSARERVIRCLDKVLQREVLLESPGQALKAVATSDGADRAMREARVLAGVVGDGIPRILEVLPGEDGPILVLESHAGETLEARLRNVGPLTSDEVRQLLLDLSVSLESVHRASVIHRNLSTETVLLLPGGTAVLRGFRHARVVRGTGGFSSFGRARRTPKREEMEVQPAHIAPEQFGGKPSSVRTDLFALGCVAYEAATGRPAFANPMERAWVQPAPLRRAAPELDGKVAEVIERCLSRAESLRPNAAMDVGELLSPPRKGGASLVHVVATAACVGALGLAAVLGWRASGESSASDEVLAQRTDLKPVGPVTKPGQLSLGFANSNALVVGITEYKHLRNLTNASNDARSVAEALRGINNKHPWTVKLLDLPASSTRDKLFDAIEDFKRQAGPNDRQLFYFAGHGAPDKDVGHRGYMQPSDAVSEDPKTWISFEQLEGIGAEGRAKHAFIVLDCCYSGAANEGSGGLGRRSGELTYDAAYQWSQSPTRVLLTSGLATELVYDGWFSRGKRFDHSPFATAFLGALDSDAGVLTTDEIWAQILMSYEKHGVKESPTYSNGSAEGRKPFAFFLGDG